jgi:1-acyl-sn-glycerol-3-phosphate acyltransferase
MKSLIRFLQLIYSVYAAILFVAIMLIIFPFTLLAGFFGRIRGGNMILFLCRIWADLWFPLIFVFQKKIYEAPHDKSKAYIFLTNHISYLDAAMIPKAYRQHLRPLGKVEMSKIPVFGFIYRHAIVAVDRNNANDRAKSVRLLKSLLNKGISVLVFPEGTFNMTTNPLKEFYDGAFRIAIETQTPLKPVLFLDAYRRMPYENIFRMSPGRNRVLYLEEIPVSGYTIKDAGRLKEMVFAIMEKKLIEYDAAWRVA